MVFFFFLLATAFLFYLYGRDVEKDVQATIVAEELERSNMQAREFADQVRRALEKTKFRHMVEGKRSELLDFKKLTDRLMKQNRYIAYVHLQDETGETLMFKGPKVLQKIVLNDSSMTFMERTTEALRYLNCEVAPGHAEGIHDLSTLLLSDENKQKRLGRLRVGISRDRVAAYAQKKASQAPVGSHLSRYLLFTGLLVSFAYLAVWYHLNRIHTLEESLAYQTRLAYVGTLASGLVHELRNPLNGLNLNVSLLEDELAGLPEETALRLTRLLGRIKPGLGHLEKISSEFLAFARPPKVQLEPVDVNAVVREAVDVLREECAAGNIDCRLDLDENIGFVELDRTRLRQILLNLMVNAIQAMEGGGVMTVVTSASGDRLELSIADTGPGFSEEARNNLFRLFFTTKEGGVGLGLPIVKRLIQDLAGTIDLDSRIGKGTRFVIEFPLRALKQED